jgi:hypothetical protein
MTPHEEHSMKTPLILAFCTVAVLTACGGGGADDNPATPAVTAQVMPEASKSAAGLIGYLKLLVAASADTLEPVDVSAVTPSADDSADPAVVD